MKRRIVFLVDGIGAFLSASVLLILLIFFQKETGIPPALLKTLIVIAVIYFCFAMFCYFVIQEAAAKMLKVLIVLNLLYCAANPAIVFFFWNELTLIGKLYLLFESMVLLILVLFEKKQLDLFSSGIKS
jgi:hypothetical protein